MHLGLATGLGPTQQPSQAAVALFAEATVLNDLTPTSTPATNAYDPYIGDGAYQNLLLRSQEFDNATWTSTGLAVSVTNNAAVAPDGTTTAEKIIATAATNYHYIRQTLTKAASSLRYTFSAYLKAADYQYGVLQMLDGANGVQARFNLQTGVVSQTQAFGAGFTVVSASAVSVGNGWYRCIFIADSTTSTTLDARIWTQQTDAFATFLGDGTSGILAWGAQMVQAETAGIYAVTTSAAAYPRRRRPILVAGRSVSSDLIESGRTNLVIRSQDFASASWVATRVSKSSTTRTAPDGSATAGLFVEDSSNNTHIWQSASITVAGSTTYAWSFYAKAAGRRYLRMTMTSGQVTGMPVMCDLQAGSVSGGTATSAVFVGNGWWRFSGTVTTVAVPTAINIFFALDTDGVETGSGESYQGDGASGVDMWGVQLEAGAFPSSYIPTTAASVTRGADSLSVSLASLSGGGLSTTAGTILALTVPYGWDVAASGGASGYAAYTVSPAGTFSNAVLRHNVGGANVNARRVDSTPSGNEVTAGATVSGLNRFAHVWSGSEHRLYASGVSVSVDNSVLSPYTLDTAITLGNQTGGSAYLHGWVGLLYWPRALTAAEIATVSQQSGLAGAGAL